MDGNCRLISVRVAVAVSLAGRAGWYGRRQKPAAGRSFEPATFGRVNATLELADSIAWRSLRQWPAELFNLRPRTFESRSNRVARRPVARKARETVDLRSGSGRRGTKNVSRPFAIPRANDIAGRTLAVARVQAPQLGEDLIKFPLDSRQPGLQILGSNARAIESSLTRRVLAVAAFARSIGSFPITPLPVAVSPITSFALTSFAIAPFAFPALTRGGVV
jgi:hypothetical protein